MTKSGLRRPALALALVSAALAFTAFPAAAERRGGAGKPAMAREQGGAKKHAPSGPAVAARTKMTKIRSAPTPPPQKQAPVRKPSFERAQGPTKGRAAPQPLPETSAQGTVIVSGSCARLSVNGDKHSCKGAIYMLHPDGRASVQFATHRVRGAKARAVRLERSGL